MKSSCGKRQNSGMPNVPPSRIAPANKVHAAQARTHRTQLTVPSDDQPPITAE
jgi:hypothetical protein